MDATHILWILIATRITVIILWYFSHEWHGTQLLSQPTTSQPTTLQYMQRTCLRCSEAWKDFLGAWRRRTLQTSRECSSEELNWRDLYNPVSKNIKALIISYFWNWIYVLSMAACSRSETSCNRSILEVIWIKSVRTLYSLLF